jgi:hypothetical protein
VSKDLARSEKVRTGSTAAPPKGRSEDPAWLDEFKRAVAEALSGAGDPGAVRRLAADLLIEMAERVWASEIGTGKNRSQVRNTQRQLAIVGAAIAPFAAGGAGGALAARLGGWWATALGIGVVAAAAVAAVSSVLRAEYERNRRKSRRYEKLRWDIRTYAILTLPTVDLASIAPQLEHFSTAIEAVGEV